MARQAPEKQDKQVGSREIVSFQVAWSAARGASRESATGQAVLWVRDRPVWAMNRNRRHPAPIIWSWIDLLEHLARIWPRLSYEQAYPFGLTPETPLKLRESARMRWASLELETRAPETYLAEDEELFRFEAHHDLAYGLKGISVPAVFLLREGNMMWICTDRTAHLLPFEEVMASLEAIGEEIATHLAQVGTPRAELVRGVWASRNEVQDEKVVALLAGMTQQELAVVEAGVDSRQFWEIRSPRIRDNEIFAAARATRAFTPAGELRELLRSIKALPRYETPFLDSLSTRAEEYFRSSSHLFYEQGQQLAGWLREQLSIAPHEPVDPEAILTRWGVPIKEMPMGASYMEAIAVWGEAHGPAIILNTDGDVAGTPHGRRSTLAHEICHLLIDRKRELPFLEAMISGTKQIHERRARAFAAELLLPRQTAYEVVRTSNSLAIALGEQTTPGSLGTALDQLMQEYGVGKQIAGWQIKNSGATALLSGPDLTRLIKITESPDSFETVPS